MSFIQVTKEEFNTHAQQVSERSFMQTEEMAKLLEKRGFSISYVAWKEGNQLESLSNCLQHAYDWWASYGGELWTDSLKYSSSK